ncbi:MAG TPA: YciI family protein [Streptosporangiaceae bacterium]|jgi:hypothetical protein|nr:YciI family protein [Streptosporangiaceae bacterium]
MKYMLIHCVDESRDRSQDPPDYLEAVQRSLASWIAEMDGRGVLVHGDQLQPVSDATTVRVRGGDVLVADGPFAETKEQIGGYDVIDCADLDKAIEVASKHPTAAIGTIEVRPFWTE